MSRPRRPPGAGPALTLLTLLLLPSLLVAAQQQQPLDNNNVRSRRAPSAEARVEHIQYHNQQHHQKHGKHYPEAGVSDDQRQTYVPVISQNERAVAKVSSAPAIDAVGARRGTGAASGVLAPGARSLQDWEVEDFVLLATVDGHIHARDRYNGEEIWKIEGEPMLTTTYNNSEGHANLQDQPFVWIVEPTEDGALYVLLPGPYPILQKMGLTVKELSNIAPYSTDEDTDFPVVYNVDKKTNLINLDAARGLVNQQVDTKGVYGSKDASCISPAKSFFNERDCRGKFEIGQIEYTISIHNTKTSELLCTIKYVEWTTNSRDSDLKSQYTKTLDDQYIYGRYDGEIIAYDHKRTRPRQRPMFTQRLQSPVARVFDVARPANDDSAQAPLVLLPQPAGPQTLPGKINHVLLNTTETGAWYALSEMSYPAVTDGAPLAPIYSQDKILTLDDDHELPSDGKVLVGVHILNHHMETQSRFPAIAAPTNYQIDDEPVVSRPAQQSPMERPSIEPPPPTFMHTESRLPSLQVMVFAVLVAMFISFAKWKMGPGKLAPLWSYLSSQMDEKNKTKQLSPVSATPEPEAEAAEEKEVEPEAVEVAPTVEVTVEPTVEEKVDNRIEQPQLLPPIEFEQKEKKVSFDIPEEDEEDMSLSRTTTIDQASSLENSTELTATTSVGEASPGPSVASNSLQDSTLR